MKTKRTPTQQLAYRALAANPLHGTLLAVYRFLEHYAETNPRITNRQLAADADLSEDHVQRCVKLLEKLGLVRQKYMHNGDLSTRVVRIVKGFDVKTLTLLENLAEGHVKIQIKTVEVRVPRKLKSVVPEGVSADLPRWSFVLFEDQNFDLFASENREFLLAEMASEARSVSFSGGLQGGLNAVGTVAQKVTAVRDKQNELFSRELSVKSDTGSLRVDEGSESNRAREFRWSELAPARQAAITAIIEYWVVAVQWSAANAHTQARRQRVNTRLGKFSAEQLMKCIDAVMQDAWYRDKPNLLDIKWMFNNHERVEQLLMRARKGPGAPAKVDRRAAHLAASNKPVTTESM